MLPINLLEDVERIEAKLDREYENEYPNLSYIRGLQDKRIRILSGIVKELVRCQDEERK